MGTIYEVRAGHRVMALQAAASAQEALLDHLRAIGCRDDDEIVRMGDDAAVWRGALYTAVPATLDVASGALVGARA